MTGDHVRFLRGNVWEHAIDVGDRTAIHFATGEGVRRAPLAQLAGATPVEVVTHTEPVFAPRRVVDRAFSRLAETAYRGMFRDSEAFAVWCKSGRVPFATMQLAPGFLPAAAGGGRSTPSVKAATSREAPVAGKPPPTRKAAGAKTAAPAKKAAPARKGAPAKKAVARQPAPKRGAPAKKLAAAKKVAPLRKGTPAARGGAPAKAARGKKPAPGGRGRR